MLALQAGIQAAEKTIEAIKAHHWPGDAVSGKIEIKTTPKEDK